MTIRLLCCSGSLEGGGSERQLWQLATGVDPSIFSPHVYLHYRRGKFLACLPPSIPVHDFWNNYSPTIPQLPGQIHRAQVRDLCRYVREQEIDVVYDRTFHMTLVTAPACRQSGCARVSVIVSPPSLDFKQSRERFSILKKWLLHRAYADRRSQTLAVSDSVAGDASIFYNIRRDAIEVVRSPVDIHAIHEAARQASAWFQPAAKRVCVVGRMSHEKGQRLAIQAFIEAVEQSQDRAMVLDLIGDGPERASLESFGKTTTAASQIMFHGFQDNPYPLIAAADLLLIPSDYEGLPNVALEAMCLKTALVATECSGALNQLIGNNERGQLVPLGNASIMAQAIQNRFGQPKLWETRLESAYAYVDTHHSLPPWLQKMEQLLTRVSGHTASTSGVRHQPNSSRDR